MGNVNWVILGFRPEKCTQFFLGPRTSDFRPGYRISYIKGSKKQFFLILNFVQTKKTIFHSFFHNFFSRFSIYLAPSGAKYCEKGWETPFELLDFWKTRFGFLDFGKIQAVIKSAASAASQRPNQGIKSGNPRSGERPDDGARWDDGAGRATDRIRATARGRSPDLGFPDLIP